MSIYNSLCSFQIFVCMLNAAGFEYPSTIPYPIQLHDALMEQLSEFNFFELPTPLSLHCAFGFDIAAYECMAYYDDTYLSAFSQERPPINTPSLSHSTETKALCFAYVWPKMANFFFATNSTFSPEFVQYVTDAFARKYGIYPIPSVVVHEDVLNCYQDRQCLMDVAHAHNYYPYIISSIIADHIIYKFSNDGWNKAGSLVYRGDGGDGYDDTKVTKCTAGCRPYKDYTNYQPQNSPFDDNDKGNEYWQPLEDTNFLGIFSIQQHVLPQIATKGTNYLFDDYVQAYEPNYNYDLESYKVIDRLKYLANDDWTKMVVEFFNNKGLIRDLIFDSLKKQYNVKLTYEKLIIFRAGLSFGQDSAILQAWNQKLKFDRVRPTTWIQNWGDRKIETYGGPYRGVQTINARDFVTYIRVEEHSEYPSGSTCICTALQEFTDLFVQYYFGDASIYDLTIYFPKYSSVIEPGFTPKEDLRVTLKNMDDVRETCGQSRLWGGMHFTASVDSSSRICQGIGYAAFERMIYITNPSSRSYGSDTGKRDGWY